MRTYKTNTGTYLEDELSVLVWVNPKSSESRQSRYLETMTSDKSSFPMAFPSASFVGNKEWRNATAIHSREQVFEVISKTSRAKPLIVPIPIARITFGWENFYIPSEYTV